MSYPDVDCPYCGKGQEIDHDDGVGYEEDRTYRQDCADCGKTFVYTTSISFSYDAEKADCLNGSEHNYQPSHTFPKKYTKMVCKMCDDERQPTKEEREKYKLDDGESLDKLNAKGMIDPATGKFIYY
ncbi:MAG: hypothetical protein KCHDKBKB_00667 [Elusimicrobia bacterium]|nr:hypothetical protein [Elusimicrobiota bacterium]